LNYCLDELIDPIKNLPKAALTGVAITSTLYIFATLSFFVVVPKDMIDVKTALLAAKFSTMAMGPTIGQRILPVFIALSAFGSGMCMAFANSRIILAASRDGYLPYAHVFGVTTGKGAPIAGLLLNMVVSLVWMLAPPPGPVFKFLVELSCYPKWIFYGLSVGGLLYLRFVKPNISRPFKSFWISNLLFIAVAIFLTVFPFVPPAQPDSSGIPYYLYAVLGAGFIILCIPWWAYQMPKKESIADDLILEQSVPLQDVVHHFDGKKKSLEDMIFLHQDEQ
jgi:amino acid transporter